MTATRSNTNARFRARKLSTKNPLQIVTEGEIDAVDDDPQRAVAEIETGVDKNEETEHHLQAAISASQAAAVGGKVQQSFIPTPDASKTVLDYDRLYKKRFKEPFSYIRFSSTVEDCSGCLYSIREIDDEFIEKTNASRPAGSKITEDAFEAVIQHFESTTLQKQPWLLQTDEIHLMSLEDLEAEFDPEFHDDSLKSLAKIIYPHWKEQRLQRDGRPLMPTLKFEQGQIDKDESDPYVCFRRREHRPARKTRRTDTQSIEKLKTMRSTFEDGRELISQVLQREMMKQDSLKMERAIFENRSAVKDLKRRLGIKGDDEDLVNKPRKRPAFEQPTPIVKVPQARQDGKSHDADLVSLEDRHRIKKMQLMRSVEERRAVRASSNAGWVDRTAQALELPAAAHQPQVQPSYGGKSKYRTVSAVYAYSLPTPPDSPPENEADERLPTIKEEPGLVFKPSAPSAGQKRKLGDGVQQAQFRSRRGRYNGLWVDRTNSKMPEEYKQEIDELVMDRYKFDCDDSDDEMLLGNTVHLTDSDPQRDIKFKADLFMAQVLPAQQNANRRAQAANDSSAHSSSHGNHSNVTHANSLSAAPTVRS